MPYKDKEKEKQAKRKHYLANKDKVNERSKINKEKARVRNVNYVWDYLSKNPCVSCGESNPIVLEFDHLRDKYKNVSTLARGGCSIEKLQKEIDKCQVLCANCHLIKTSKDFGWYKNILRSGADG